MKELFKIKDIPYYEEDFLDDINDYLDIIPILKEYEDSLDYERITCTEENACCHIHGYITKEDEFITKEEQEEYNIDRADVDLFVIRVYKCVDCGKWIIDILED